MSGKEDLYKVPAIQPPTENDIRRISEKLRLNCSPDEIAAFTDHCSRSMKAFDRINELDDYDLEVKYPRTPGKRPKQDENIYNAWAWMCDIQGASSGKLLGKTVGIKDCICVAGVPMTIGSKIFEGYTPEIDATIVTRILDAGGRIVGKTSVEDMCKSGSSFTNIKGPVVNPHDRTRTSGGSSSGSAVVVQTGDVDMAIGGDQGGSIRIPASYCGIVGLKPTFGLVPYTGVCPLALEVDTIGPMARTVTDCALLLEVIAGADNGLDSRQPYSIDIPKYSELLETSLEGRKIACLKEGFDKCTPAVRTCVRNAAEQFKELGVSLHDVSVPIHLDGPKIYTALVTQGHTGTMDHNSARGYRCLSLQEALTRGAYTRPYDIPDTMKNAIVTSEYISGKCQNKYYSKAHNLTLKLREAYDNVLKEFDVIVLPVFTDLPPLLPTSNSSTYDRIQAASVHRTNVSHFNLSGHPALSINAGYIDGLPFGIMIVGQHFGELSVLQFAKGLENLQNKCN